MIDVMRIYHSLEKRNLQAAYRFYCGKPLEDAHSAEVDVCATYEVLKAQIHLYQSIEAVDAQGNSFAPIQNDVQTLSDFTPFNRLDPTGKVAYNDEGAIVFMFGKYKGEPLSQVFTTNPDYYEWLMSRDFSVFSKRVFEAEYKKLNL
jgi:DNA polymerase-3 subunit epsilon